MPKMYSDNTLGLNPRWFTGREWADGTAQRELKREYREAIERAKKDDAKSKGIPTRS